MIEHIEKFHTGYIQNEEYKSRLLQNDGQEAMEQTIAGHEQVVNEIVPYLKLHDSLSQMEQAAGQAMREADNLARRKPPIMKLCNSMWTIAELC